MTSQPHQWRALLERIMLGQESPGALYLPLAAAQAIYSAGAALRNKAYDRALISSHRAPCPVISVGGLTLGGSGKTPLTIKIAQELMPKKKVGILSRGYGQQASEKVLVVSDGRNLCAPPPYSADEPYMVAKKLPGACVVTAPNRRLGAMALAEWFGVEVIILDDGFGHRAMARDMDIVLVDEHTLDPARRQLFPLGYLREPAGNLARADVAVIMVRSREDEERLEEWKEEIRKLAGGAMPVATARGAITGFARMDGQVVDSIPGPALAFCGIANPAGFAVSLMDAGVTLAGRLPFADHHQYSSEDIRAIGREAHGLGAASIVTTQKDAARLEGLWNAPELEDRLYVAQWELKLDGFEDRWLEL